MRCNTLLDQVFENLFICSNLKPSQQMQAPPFHRNLGGVCFNSFCYNRPESQCYHSTITLQFLWKYWWVGKNSLIWVLILRTPLFLEAHQVMHLPPVHQWCWKFVLHYSLLGFSSRHTCASTFCTKRLMKMGLKRVYIFCLEAFHSLLIVCIIIRPHANWSGSWKQRDSTVLVQAGGNPFGLANPSWSSVISL